MIERKTDRDTEKSIYKKVETQKDGNTSSIRYTSRAESAKLFMKVHHFLVKNKCF